MSEEETDCGKTAYEAWQLLPAAPKETKPWRALKNAERNGWRAIARAVLDVPLTGPEKPTKP